MTGGLPCVYLQVCFKQVPRNQRMQICFWLFCTDVIPPSKQKKNRVYIFFSLGMEAEQKFPYLCRLKILPFLDIISLQAMGNVDKHSEHIKDELFDQIFFIISSKWDPHTGVLRIEPREVCLKMQVSPCRNVAHQRCLWIVFNQDLQICNAEKIMYNLLRDVSVIHMFISNAHNCLALPQICETQSERMAQHIFQHCLSDSEYASYPKKPNISLHLYEDYFSIYPRNRPPSALLPYVLGLNILHCLQVDYIDQLEDSCTQNAISTCITLTTLSMGYSSSQDGIPDSLIAACKASSSLRYAGAYTNHQTSPIDLLNANDIIPYPHTWRSHYSQSMIILQHELNLFKSNAVEYFLNQLLSSQNNRRGEAYKFSRCDSRAIDVYHCRLYRVDLTSTDIDNTALLPFVPICNTHRSSAISKNNVGDYFSFHGTSHMNVASMIQTGHLTTEHEYDEVYTTPHSHYALHPSFAIPVFLTPSKDVACQFLAVCTHGTSFKKQPASIPCCLAGHETIEWKHAPRSKVTIHCIYAVIYTNTSIRD